MENSDESKKEELAVCSSSSSLPSSSSSTPDEPSTDDLVEAARRLSFDPNSKITLKLFDSTKSIFKRLSYDDEDRTENARKLQAFLDCVLPGEEQRPVVSLSRFLGLLPPFVDGVAHLRQLTRASLRRETNIDDTDQEMQSYSGVFEQREEGSSSGVEGKDEEEEQTPTRECRSDEHKS